jgi:hypothetical protein
MLHGFTSQKQMLFTSHCHYDLKSHLDAKSSARRKLKLEQKFNIYIYIYIVRSESRCALRLRYVDLVKLVQTCIKVCGHHFQQIL